MDQSDTAPTQEAGISKPAPRRGIPLWGQIIVWVALLGLLTVVAFGLRRSQQGTVQKGDVIPDFTLSFFDGYQLNNKSDVKLSELKGKVVVVNFWASWCKPCEQEAAELEAAWRAYEPGGQVIFIPQRRRRFLGIELDEALGDFQFFGQDFPDAPDLFDQSSHPADIGEVGLKAIHPTLDEESQHQLFPDNTYGVNSGGDPTQIVEIRKLIRPVEQMNRAAAQVWGSGAAPDATRWPT